MHTSAASGYYLHNNTKRGSLTEQIILLYPFVISSLPFCEMSSWLATLDARSEKKQTISCTDKKQVHTCACLQRTSMENPALPPVLVMGARLHLLKGQLEQWGAKSKSELVS